MEQMRSVQVEEMNEQFKGSLNKSTAVKVMSGMFRCALKPVVWRNRAKLASPSVVSEVIMSEFHLVLYRTGKIYLFAARPKMK